MRREWLLLIIVFVFVNLISISKAQEWVLQHNLTFDTVNESQFTTSGGTWSLPSVTGGGRKGNSLYRSDSNSNHYAYINNATFYLNDYDNKLKIQFWFRNHYTGDWTYGGTGLINGSNRYQVAGNVHTSGNQHRIIYRADNGDEINPYINYAGSNDFNWQVMFVENGTITLWSYEDSSNSSMIQQRVLNTSARVNFGNLMFGSFRSAMWDDVEIWKWEESGGSPPASNPSMTINENLVNGTQNNNDDSIFITYNATFSDETRQDANCSLFVNGLLNMTDSNVNLSMLQDFNYSYPDTADAWYDFQINCSNFEANDSTDVYTYHVDLVLPSISTDYINNTVYNDTDTFTVNNTFFDNNLYAYNISFINQSGHVLENIFVDNLTGGTYSNRTSRNLNASWIGNTTMRLEAWDSHTKFKIPDFEIEFINGGIIYENSILIFGNTSKLVSFGTKKKKDRYYWEVEFNNKNTWNYLVLQSNSKLYFKEYFGYANFIDLQNCKWVDFVSQDITNWYIEKIDDKTYKIWFYNTEKKLYFDSIGDLNNNKVEYFVQVTETPESPSNLEVLLDNIDEDIASIASDMSDVSEGINMLWVIILYIGFMTLGYHMIQTSNILGGISLFLMSVILDFLISAKLEDIFRPDIPSSGKGTYIAIFIVLTLIWIFVKGLVILSLRKENKYYRKV